MTGKEISRITQLRISFVLGFLGILSSGAFAADSVLHQVMRAGWENAMFISAPIISWLVGSAIFRSKIDQKVAPGEAARSSFWWLLGFFTFICAVVLLVIIAFTAPWWLWLVLVAVPLLCFILGFVKGRR